MKAMQVCLYITEEHCQTDSACSANEMCILRVRDWEIIQIVYKSASR